MNFRTCVLEASTVKKIACSSLSIGVSHGGGDAEVHGVAGDSDEFMVECASSVTVCR
jgi:hypothetical protein